MIYLPDRIADKILPFVKEWQEKPLEEVYAVIFMDAIHYHVSNESRIVKCAVYIAIGIDMEGYKTYLVCMSAKRKCEILAFYSHLNGLKNRGVKDILIAVTELNSLMKNGAENIQKQQNP